MEAFVAFAFAALFSFEGGRLFRMASDREVAGEDLSLDWFAEIIGAAALLVLSMLILALT